MKLLLIVLVVVVAASAQRGTVDPRNAAILAEGRYLKGDGSFGSAYVSDDGTEFKEETDGNGDRRGQYSYVDNKGMKFTVHYTAGKNGFQVSGDHLPKAPAPLAAQPQQAPVQQYNPAPQYNTLQQQQQQQSPPRQQQQQQQIYVPQGGAIEDGQYDPSVYEAPYAYREDNQQQYQNLGPAPTLAPQQQFNQGFNYQHQGYSNNYQQQPIQPTQQPTRFFPPGKLDLNRTPDGFNYQFQSRQ